MEKVEDSNFDWIQSFKDLFESLSMNNLHEFRKEGLFMTFGLLVIKGRHEYFIAFSYK